MMSFSGTAKYYEEHKQRAKWLESLTVGSRVRVTCRFPQDAPVTRQTAKQLLVTIKYGESDWEIRFWRKTGNQVGGGMRIWPAENA